MKPHWVLWYAHRVEEHRLPKGAAAREALAAQVGQDGTALLIALDEPGATHLHDLPEVQVLRLMWTQHFESGSDGVLHWKPLSSVPPASQRPASPYDPEAHFACKRSLTWEGYKVHLTETGDDDLPELITNVLVTPAAQQDLLAAHEVHQQLADHALLPEQHLMDSGYVGARLLTDSRERYDIDVMGPPPRHRSWQERTAGAFTIKDFRIDWERKDAYCPQNFLNSPWIEMTDAWGTPIVHVEFRRRTCERCPVRSRCTRTDKTKAGRSLVFRRQAGHDALQAARAREEAAGWQTVYALRDGIEATVSQAVRRLDLRHARYWGQAKTRLQMLGTAAALNLIRMDAWLAGIPRGVTRTARFARLPLIA